MLISKFTNGGRIEVTDKKTRFAYIFTVLSTEVTISIDTVILVSGKNIQVCVSNIIDVTVNDEAISWTGAIAVFQE